MTRLHRTFAIPVLAASLVLLGACGASTTSAKNTTAKDNKSTTTVAKGTGGGATTTDGKSATTATPDTTPSKDTKPSKGGKVELSGSFCNMLKQLDAEGDDLFLPQEDADPAKSLKNLKESFSKMIDAFHKLQSKAPAEIKADVDFTVNEFEKMNDQIQKLTTYTPDAMMSIVGADFDSPEAQQHNDRIDAYTKDTCGFDPNADSPSSDTAS